MPLTIPDFALVLLVGASGSGKSTFAARHFRPTEVLSSDRCRGMVADDEQLRPVLLPVGDGLLVAVKL